MKKMLLAGTLLASIGAVPAHATLQIAFTDGTNVVTCADQQSGCDIDSATKGLFKIFTTVGDFQIFATVATSTSGKVNNLEVTNAIIKNTGDEAGQLRFVVGDTNFTGPVKSVLEGASLTFNNNIGLASSLQFFADSLDGQPGGPTLNEPGVNLFSVSDTSTQVSQAFSGNNLSAFLANSPFSMAEGATLNMEAGASITGFSESMTTAVVPEPRTWALMGLGFAAVGLIGLKRRRGSIAIA